MLRRPWWLLALLLPACVAPSWTITPLKGQTVQQQDTDRARCRWDALWRQTRDGNESRAWWGGPIATMGVDPAAYQGCLEARGYRVQ